jgi:hypothetical protein
MKSPVFELIFSTVFGKHWIQKNKKMLLTNVSKNKPGFARKKHRNKSENWYI